MFILIVITAVYSNQIDDLNNSPQSTWKAKEYPPEVMNLNAIRSKLIHPWVAHVKNTSHDEFISSAPDSFDSRVQWPGIMIPVYEPSDCPSSSAMAIVETMSDRIGIINNAETVYSLGDLVYCDPNSYGCDGAFPDLQWTYVEKTGLALDSCIPNTDTSCPKTCADGSTIIRRTAKTVYSVVGVDNMQNDLQTNGPFTVEFDIYEDFFFYETGVYQHTFGNLEGGEMALVVGWGVSGGLPYWIVQMGWGPNFGIDGYAWILRGHDECGIEDNGYAALF